eukprot:s2108_g8.t3
MSKSRSARSHASRPLAAVLAAGGALGCAPVFLASRGPSQLAPRSAPSAETRSLQGEVSSRGAATLPGGALLIGGSVLMVSSRHGLKRLRRNAEGESPVDVARRLGKQARETVERTSQLAQEVVEAGIQQPIPGYLPVHAQAQRPFAMAFSMAVEALGYYVTEKNTFIEVCLPEDATQPPRRKSWSCGDSGCEITLSLPLRPGRIDTGESKPDMEDEETTKLEQHANGTCKPCVFFASGVGCSRSKCRFCHLAHNPPSTKRPRKQIRESFKAAVTKVFKEVQAGGSLFEPDALHAALQDLAVQDRYVRLLIIGQIESLHAEQAPGKAAEAASKTAQSIGAQAKSISTQASLLKDNLGNLKAVPSELGEKFQRPFKEVSSAAKGAGDKLANLQAPKPKKVDAPNVIEKVSKMPGNISKIPGDISKRFQETAEGVEKTVTGIIELPDRLSKGASRASEAVVSTGEAIANFPGKVQATAEYVAKLPGNTAKKVEDFVDGVNNVVTNVVSLPERTAKSVDATVTGVTRTAEAIVSLPSRVKETADNVVGGVTSTVDTVTSVPKKVKDSVDSVKQSVDNVASIPANIKSSVDGVITTGKNVVGAVEGVANFFAGGVSAIASAAGALADLAKKRKNRRRRFQTRRHERRPRSSSRPTWRQPRRDRNEVCCCSPKLQPQQLQNAMASSELEGALSRRRELAEADGAVFEGSPHASAADTAWDQRHETQFTPRGKHRKPDVGRLQLPQEDDESTGTVTPREEILPPGKAREQDSKVPLGPSLGVMPVVQRKSFKAAKDRSDRAEQLDADTDVLLQNAAPTKWTDSFILLQVLQWAINRADNYFRAPDTRSGKKKQEEPELPFKEAAMQYVQAHKVPLGLMAIFVATCAIIIAGENLDTQIDRQVETVDDYYGVLGVTRDAETGDIKRAYKTLAKRWHPDRNPNCSSCQEAFSKIAIAYETLSDESKRGAYDEAGGVAASELKSAKSVPLTRDNFHELVTFSNDVWIVQVFRPDNPHCASFHPFWENQIQKYGHLVRFGRIDLTDDQAKWLPLKVRVLPTVLKFAKHLGNVEIFPVTQMHETPHALMKFVLTSFPNIGLPLNVDKGALTSWLSKSTRRHKVLFAIPGKSEEERYKSHLIVRKLAARWSEIFEMRSAEMAILHQLQGLPEVKAALPAESQKAAVLFFPAAGVTVPKAYAAFDWPSGEEEIVLELLRFTEKVGVPLSVQNAELMCRSLVIRRVYCLVLVDASDFAMARAAQDLGASRNQYQGEVAEIRAGGGEVSEDEDNFVVPILRLLRNPQRWSQSPSIASCYAPKFPQVEKALGASSAFLMDLDTSRIVPLRLSSFRGLYPQIAYEDSLTWVEGLDPIRSLPDCSEGLRQRYMRNLANASISEVLWQLLCALFLVEAAAKALTSQSWRWWLGVRCTKSPTHLARQNSREAPEVNGTANKASEDSTEALARQRAQAAAEAVQAAAEASEDSTEALARQRAQAAAEAVQAAAQEKDGRDSRGSRTQRSAEALAPPVEIDVTVAACAPEREEQTSEAAENSAAPTEPASPAGGPRESLEFSWAPARLPDPGVPRPEDLLNTSSRTYSRPYAQSVPQPEIQAPKQEGPELAFQIAMQQELERSLQLVQQQQYSEHMQQQQPFPKARGTVRQSRLEEVAAEVAGLVPQVNAMVVGKESQDKPMAHPTELEALLKRAKDILEASRLTEQDLEGLGWPTRELKAIRDLVSSLQKWQSCEQAAKEALGPKLEALTDVVTVLEQMFTAWRNLSSLTTYQGDPERIRIRADFGMRSRASASTPLVSALLDKAIARVRHEPDLVAVRRLEALLTWQVELGSKSAACELGVLPFLEQMLKEHLGLVRLVTADGNLLANPDESLETAGDGSVVTWGDPDEGGDSSTVRDQLRSVQDVQATQDAFAAILEDGSVVAWGNPKHGGDTSPVRDKLKKVQRIQANRYAFAAILEEKESAVAWGDSENGGDISAVQDQLVNVKQVQATCSAFAAILANGSVIAWGNVECGGDNSAVRDQLQDVRTVQANQKAFAAISSNGSVITWGKETDGGDSSKVRDLLRDVHQIAATDRGFAAIRRDGSVVTWGYHRSGGDSSLVQDQLRNVKDVQAARFAFAAICCDGSLVTWGQQMSGGDCSAIQDKVRNVEQIQASSGAFAAILADGSLVAWGSPEMGGDCSAVQSQLTQLLSECLQGTTRLQSSFQMPGNSTLLSTPEVLWRAIVHGDLASVESIIRHGGLVSGRTQDPSGHSVLWNAIAFERPEVALLLLRSFPPDMLHGVALGELHQRNGNSLLHLVSSFQHFNAQCEGLFAMLFERMPEALRIHRNLRGQSFLHIAAGRRNLWILSYAASRGLAAQFSVADSGGLSPQKLLGQHLELMRLHRPVLSTGGTKMPTWCSFSALQPATASAKPPFADVAVEIEGEERIYAHRVIISAASQKWHQQLRAPNGDGDIQVLQITSCKSTEVVSFALRYLYTGDVDTCTFQKDSTKLLELLQFCRSEELPSSLCAWAADGLLQSESGFVATLLLEAPKLGLPPAAQRFLAYRFICDDVAWQAAAEAEVNGHNGSSKVPMRSAALTTALSALESAQFGA